MIFVNHGLKIICAKFRDDWTTFVIGVFDVNQDGGEPNMAQSDDVGCVELGLAQGSNDTFFVNIG